MLEASVIDVQMQVMKGGSPLRVSSYRMTPGGLETVDGRVKSHSFVAVTATPDDRGDHNFFSQRKRVNPKDDLYVPGTPKLALIQPDLVNGNYVLRFDGANEIKLPDFEEIDPTNIINVQVWEYRGGAVEVPKLSEWLSDCLESKVKVASTSGPWNRMARQNFMKNSNPLRAQDGYPVHAVSLEDTIAIFNALGTDIDPNRFRYQVLLEGVPFRKIHDYARGEINGILVDQPKPCDRCDVTGNDQEKGEVSTIKPLAAFKELGVGGWIRPDTGKTVQVVGENWLPQGECIISQGDTFTFTTLRKSPLQFAPAPQRRFF